MESLSNCKIVDKDVEKIMKSLSSNAVLEEFDLSRNEFGSDTHLCTYDVCYTYYPLAMVKP